MNDASCLIDLRKADLLAATLALPYRFVVPLPLVHTELIDFAPADWAFLEGQGLEILDLEPMQVGRALAIVGQNAKLSANDAFSLALAETLPDSILLTGDQELRRHAAAGGVEVHGVLWVADQLETLSLITLADLLAGLHCWQRDPLVFLPVAELERRVTRVTLRLQSLR